MTTLHPLMPLDVHADQGSGLNKVLSFVGPHTLASSADDSRILHAAAFCLYAQCGSSSFNRFSSPTLTKADFAALRSLLQDTRSKCWTARWPGGGVKGQDQGSLHCSADLLCELERRTDVARRSCLSRTFGSAWVLSHGSKTSRLNMLLKLL